MSAFFPVTLHLSASPLVLEKPRSSGRELRALMDQRRMDVEGGRAVRRSSRVGRLAVVVAVQNLLVVTCLLVTVYLYMMSPVLPEDGVYIQFNELRELIGNKHLEFGGIKGKHRFELEPNKTDISISCSGPYVWHLYACCLKTVDVDGTVYGTLTLQVENTTISSVIMNATSVKNCRGLQSIVYLKAGDVANFHLHSPRNFRIESLSMGLSYMLGNKCEY